jgi:hypothetical protein
MSELRERRLDDVDLLAEALGVTPSASRALLKRDVWNLEEATWVLQRLQLPISVRIERR